MGEPCELAFEFALSGALLVRFGEVFRIRQAGVQVD